MDVQMSVGAGDRAETASGPADVGPAIRLEERPVAPTWTGSPTRAAATRRRLYAFTSCFLNREPSSDTSAISPFPPKMNDTISDFRFVVSSAPPAPTLATATDASAPTSHSRVPLVNFLSASALLNARIME